jgi:REP element-mobilizing transposase RayT
MSDKYKMHEQEKAYFLTMSVVGWIDVFTRRNHAEVIYNPLFFYNKLNYIHKNPVQEMIVKNEEDYLFSSARNYADLDYLIEVIKESSQLKTH